MSGIKIRIDGETGREIRIPLGAMVGAQEINALLVVNGVGGGRIYVIDDNDPEHLAAIERHKEAAEKWAREEADRRAEFLRVLRDARRFIRSHEKPRDIHKLILAALEEYAGRWLYPGEWD